MLKGGRMKLFILLIALILITVSCSSLANQNCKKIDEGKSFMEDCMISLAIFTRSHEIPQGLMDFCYSIYQEKLKGQVVLRLEPVRIPIQITIPMQRRKSNPYNNI